MDARYIISRDGRQFVRFEGLLLAGHDAGLKSIKTTLLQAPSEQNGQTAIVQASVELEKGTFQAIGDASPLSVRAGMVPHLCRLAETRALARALRFGLGVAATAVEELGADADQDEHPTARATSPARLAPTTAPTTAPPRGTVVPIGSKSNGRAAF